MISRICLIAVIALSTSGTARAQTTGEGWAGFGAGAYSNRFSSGRVIQIGGGGEAVVQKAFGFGGDMLLGGGGGDAWIESSLRASYRFHRQGATRHVVPFVSGGYTRVGALTERGGVNGVNVGGGLTCWLGHEGVRFEVRDVVFDTGFQTTQYWTARIGISFR
jgi:hypothetical protein